MINRANARAEHQTDRADIGRLERCALVRMHRARQPTIDDVWQIMLHYHRGCSSSRLFVRHTNAVVSSRSGPAGSSRADQKNGDRSTMENRVTLPRITYSLFPHAVQMHALSGRTAHKIFGSFFTARWHRQLERKLIKFIRRFWLALRELAVQRGFNVLLLSPSAFYTWTKLRRKWIILGRILKKHYNYICDLKYLQNQLFCRIAFLAINSGNSGKKCEGYET